MEPANLNNATVMDNCLFLLRHRLDGFLDGFTIIRPSRV